MRIIAGSAGRTRLEVPRGMTRPTTDRVREALFSIIGERVIGAGVLDLYAGTGSIGLEALSRGAARAMLVEKSADACRTIEKNAGRAGFGRDQVTIRRLSVETFLRTEAASDGPPYGLIFADPPYRKEAIEPLLESADILRLLENGGWLVLEMAAEEHPALGPGWELVVERRYGGTKIMIVTRSGE